MLALLALAGCQLLVEDVPFPSCVDIDPQCVESSRERGAGTCVAYRCDLPSGRCLPFADGEEDCDGYDNDCDGVIDEAGAGAAFVAEASETITMLHPGVEDHRLRYGVDHDGLEVIVVGADLMMRREPRVVRWTRTVHQVLPLDLRSSRQIDRVDLVRALDDGCVLAPLAECVGGVCSPDPAACGFLESASTGPSTGLGSAILEPNPSRPELPVSLQVGTSALVDPRSELSFRGPPYLSNVFGGVRLDPACADCVPLFASLDAFVAPDDSTAGRAVGMLAAVSSTVTTIPDCRDPITATVGVLSLFVDHDDMRPESRWIVGSNGGVLERLGDTTALGPPALAGVGPSDTPVPEGFLVAYPDTMGVRLHFIARPSFTRIPPSCTECSEPTATPPLAPRVEPDVSIAAMNAGYVAVAAAEPRGSTVRVLLVWAEGCAVLVPQRVVARMVDLDFSAATPSVTLRAEHVLTTGGTLDSQLAVLYRESGFLRAGAEQGGATVGADEDGGFYVAYSDSSSVRLVRIRELDGEILDETPIDVTRARSLALYGATDPDDELALVYEEGDRLARVRLCR